MTSNPTDRQTLGWLGGPKALFTHYYRSRKFSGLAMSECGRVNSKAELKADLNLARCELCTSLVEYPDQRRSKPEATDD